MLDPHLKQEIQYTGALEGFGFPKLLNQGLSKEDNFFFMVMNLHGPSLTELFVLCGQQFSLKTTLMVFY